MTRKKLLLFFVVLCIMCFMDRIYTAKEVSEILHIKPYTVRQMFREGRLSGFKIGKAWRIHEDMLQSDIEDMTQASLGDSYRIERSSQVSIPEMQTEKALVNAGANFTIVDVPEKANGTGDVLIYSDPPGQEVYLDGVKIGTTTLSINDLAIGNHSISVDNVHTAFDIHKDFQTRIHVHDGKMEILSSPPFVALLDSQKTHHDSDLESFCVRIEIENETDYTGEFSLVLSADNTEQTSTMFTDHEEELDSKGLFVSRMIGSADLTELFNGFIQVNPDDLLVISVPRQEGFSGEAMHSFSIESDAVIRLTLALTGMIRKRAAVQFNVFADT